jgi:deoxyadenosine/deoxycytidine kinase
MKANHEYIAVMGTMGSGKTTAARLIAKELPFTLAEEHVTDNAFLPRFYKDMKRWAFHSQVFFLLEKLQQVKETKELLKKQSVVQDTPITQDVYSYAKAQYVLGNMDLAEWNLYQHVFKQASADLPVPDLVVFLDTSMPEIEKRISSRGRSYEKAIPVEYLSLLDSLNRTWLAENKDIPVLVVQTDKLDISRSKDAQEQFLGLVRSALRMPSKV